MAKLPRRESLGAPPSGRSGRVIATYDTTAIGRGMQQLGKGIASFGGAIGSISDGSQKVQAYEAEREFQKFQWNEQKSLDESLRTMEPSQLDGFPDTWSEGYKERAKGFFSTVPEELKPKYDLKLFGTERDLYGKAAVFTRNEQRSRALDEAKGIFDTYSSRARAGEPLDDIRKSYWDLLDSNPYLEPNDKNSEFSDGMSRLEEDHIMGRLDRGDPIDDILNDLRGGVLLDTDRNPELRGKPFTHKPTNFEPTRRFSQNVNSAINAAAEKHGIDPGMLAVFARIESGGNPNARTGSYKGLFQMSSAEFKKYGSGDIYNAGDNADAAAAKLIAEATLFEEKYGRAPMPLDLYMQHQQGIEGYRAHMANPDGLAWENMASTGEGKAKGDGWAKKAIWGNIPTDVRNQFGSVDDVTSADFIEIWRNKIERFGGGTSVVEAGSAATKYQFTGSYQHLPAEKRQTLIGKVQIAARNRTLQDIRDSVAVVKDTGNLPTDANGENALDRASRLLTRNQLEQARINVESAAMEFHAMDGLSGMKESELSQRLLELEPSPGDSLYEVRAKIFDKTKKRIDNLIEDRQRDPASSVGELEQVMVAQQGVVENPGNPDFVQGLVRARLDAQSKVGIPPGMQSPITKQEAKIIASNVKGLQGKALYEAMEPLQQKLDETYGPYARAVSRAVVESITRDKELAENVEGILNKAFKGLEPSAADVRDNEIFSEGAAAMRAIGSDVSGSPFIQYAVPGNAPGPYGGGLPPQISAFSDFGMMRFPQRAVDALMANPGLAAQFEAKYGSGSAAAALSIQGAPR